jgi:short chain dehydrogenase
MSKKVEGKIALITGGGGGKGLALAKLLVREGAHVIITDVDEEGGRSNVATVGGACEFIALDVTDEIAWEAATTQIKDRYGQLDVLINSARIHTRNADLSATSLEEWRSQTAVNLDGAFLGMKPAVDAGKRWRIDRQRDFNQRYCAFLSDARVQREPCGTSQSYQDKRRQLCACRSACACQLCPLWNVEQLSGRCHSRCRQAPHPTWSPSIRRRYSRRDPLAGVRRFSLCNGFKHNARRGLYR